MARVIAPTMTGPLRRRRDVRDAVIAAAGEQIWTDVVEKPIGEMIVRRFRDDTVRGVVATDGVIGTHTSLFDPDLLANRCFLYHLIGRGTGEWMVPIGGMGALTDALLARARALGVEIRCGVEVLHVDETAQRGAGDRLRRRRGGRDRRLPPACRGGAGRRRRLAGPGDRDPDRRPDQDQHAAGPVAPAGLRTRSGERRSPAPCTWRKASGTSRRLTPPPRVADSRQWCPPRSTAIRWPTPRSSAGFRAPRSPCSGCTPRWICSATTPMAAGPRQRRAR